jgi:hypothetical protein
MMHGAVPSVDGARTGCVADAAPGRSTRTRYGGFVREYGRPARRWEIKSSADRHLKNECGRVPAAGARGARFRHTNCAHEGSIHIDISGGFMQRYSFRDVSRAVFAGILIAGLAAGAGCQKKSDTGTSSDQGTTGGMSAAPSTAPSGTPSSGTAGTGADTGASMPAPGAASAPSGASGGG